MTSWNEESIGSKPERKRRSRFERAQLSAVRIQARDIQILETLYNYRFLTTSQIAALFFNTKKRAEHRLRKLYDANLVDRIFRPVIVGSAETIYVLGRDGVTLLSRETGTDTAEISDIRLNAAKLKPFFLDHFIDINQVRVALTSASEINNYNMLFWKYENELKNKNEQGLLIADKVKDPENPGQRIPVAPDAFFGLETPAGRAYFFLEVDRATMTNTRFKRKMTGYARYWLDGVYQEKWGYKTFRVLTTTTAKRLPNLLETTSQLREKQLLSIFHFTDRDNITPERLFSEIWRVPGDGQNKSLFGV